MNIPISTTKYILALPQRVTSSVKKKKNQRVTSFSGFLIWYDSQFETNIAFSFSIEI